MIVLEKKKIVLAISLISLFVFSYAITGYNVSKTKNDEKLDIDVKTVQTVALPVDNKTIIIDARTWKAR